MFEKEVTVLVLDQNETPIGYLNPNRVQLSETNELYSLRDIDITHPSFDENNTDPTTTFIRYDNYLANGNKLFLPESPSGDSCLYILLGDNEKDFKGNINQYAEEAATELTDYKIIRINKTVTVTTDLINTYFYELFQAGNISGPYNVPTVLNGSYTPLEFLRAIETATGGEFRFRYEYENGQINRYIDFMAQIGTTHSKVIEVGQNASAINLKVNEQDVRVAAGPKGVPSSDADSFHAAMMAFEVAEFNKTVQIPLYVSKDDAGNSVNGPLAYPTYNKPSGQNYVECDNSAELVANYQRIQASKTAKSEYARIVSDNLNNSNISTIWTLNNAVGTIVETSTLTISIPSGTNGDWWGGTAEYAPLITTPVLTGDFEASVEMVSFTAAAHSMAGLILYLDRNNAFMLTRRNDGTNNRVALEKIVSDAGTNDVATAAISSSPIWFMIRRVGTTYTFLYSTDGIKFTPLYSTSSLGFTPATVGFFAQNYSNYPLTTATFNNFKLKPYDAPNSSSQPRINAFETTETNLYNLYWLCVTNIKSSLQPEVTIDSTVVDLQKLKGFDAEHYNTGDTVKIRLPDGGIIVEARITKTVKDPRKPESDALTIGNYQSDFMKQLYRNYYKSAGNVTL